MTELSKFIFPGENGLKHDKTFTTHDYFTYQSTMISVILTG